jgi:hypothetical protein
MIDCVFSGHDIASAVGALMAAIYANASALGGRHPRYCCDEGRSLQRQRRELERYCRCFLLLVRALKGNTSLN